ncbi:unnamed protein product [Meloidogyne enterolobii]|uniref:Uncharacterized protein n=2 Tax=Meloidogyne enterolobii TaxID=390850 RepID=A0ACB0Y9M9_MELEN|nr:unnamed protein product [Meloidogyne enterolobii]
MNSQSLIILSILFAFVMLFTVESVTGELDAVELMTHHLQKRHCFCGPSHVPCACDELNNEMTVSFCGQLYTILCHDYD